MTLDLNLTSHLKRRCGKLAVKMVVVKLSVVLGILSGTISGNNPSNETLKPRSLVLHLWQQYEFPFGIIIEQFSFFFIFQA